MRLAENSSSATSSGFSCSLSKPWQSCKASVAALDFMVVCVVITLGFIGLAPGEQIDAFKHSRFITLNSFLPQCIGNEILSMESEQLVVLWMNALDAASIDNELHEVTWMHSRCINYNLQDGELSAFHTPAT